MKKGHTDKTELEKRLEAEIDRQAKADLEEARQASESDEESGPPDAMLSPMPTLEELEALTTERDDLKDQLLRSRADFENYRKRLAREAERVRKTAAEGIVRDLLPVADHLELALRHGETDSGPLAEGVSMVLKQLREVLGRHGLRPIAALGERFDPTVHEAISQRVMPDTDEHTVVEEVQTGYRLGDFVVRPAKVIVSVPLRDMDQEADKPGVAESPEGSAKTF